MLTTNLYQQCPYRCRAQENGEWVDITLSDTGTGIDLQTIASIFEPFFTTKSDIGLGLGLAISKNIIQSFGGDLTAQNNADHQGATFTLRLKRKTDAND
ncbi:ATP-binding protein [Vibrio sp. MarTm2]|uniref:ATP-binding protein n=1 Tax=Vibrio sp. MarTm2 TaxID=2998831 RepID=UPI0022CD23CF|nr:ATP-binding protein [Vibrio sp. MarTm2]MDA0127559.1 ATP-binding protein [Vibrio sp. MarTm2]